MSRSLFHRKCRSRIAASSFLRSRIMLTSSISSSCCPWISVGSKTLKLVSKVLFLLWIGSFWEWMSRSGSGSSKPKSKETLAYIQRLPQYYIPSPDPSSLSSWRISSSLEAPDMKSSSESIELSLVSGVGGAAAEATLLLCRVGCEVEEIFASAALLFLV